MTLDREIAISVQRCMLWGIQKLLWVCFQVAGNEIVSPGHTGSQLTVLVVYEIDAVVDSHLWRWSGEGG